MSHNGTWRGNAGIVAQVAASATAEFIRLNMAETAEACRVSTHRKGEHYGRQEYPAADAGNSRHKANGTAR